MKKNYLSPQTAVVGVRLSAGLAAGSGVQLDSNGVNRTAGASGAASRSGGWGDDEE